MSDELAQLLQGAVGEPLTVANEFTEVVVRRVDTRNGSRLLISAPRTGQWISLDALEVEALTWQNSPYAGGHGRQFLRPAAARRTR